MNADHSIISFFGDFSGTRNLTMRIGECRESVARGEKGAFPFPLAEPELSSPSKFEHLSLKSPKNRIIPGGRN